MKTIALYIVAAISFLFVSNSAMAQAIDGNVVLNAVKAAVSDKNPGGCFHWEFKNGNLTTHNCNGLYLGAEGGYALDHGYKAAAVVGYSYYWFRPELAAGISQATPENDAISSPEAELRLNVDFNKHSRICVFAGPTIGYKYFNSSKTIKIESTDVPLGCEANAFTFGGNAGLKIKLGTRSLNRKVDVKVGGQKVSVPYTQKKDFFLTIKGSYKNYQYYTPDNGKVKVGEISVSASLTMMF